ncbi:MAG: OsmC family protein [Mycobacteriales bacterium]|nr:OsmC family protein [Frankia sp.]
MSTTYNVHLAWTGSTVGGYPTYTREHRATAPPASGSLALSADPAYLGDEALLNPEQLVVMAASSCQMLSFLALAARARLHVVSYQDHAESRLSKDPPVRLEEISLRPVVSIAGGDLQADRVVNLAHEAHQQCYIANSLITPVTIEMTVIGA